MHSVTVSVLWPIQRGRQEAAQQTSVPQRDATLSQMPTREGDGPAGPEDAALIARFAQRDEAALGELYDRYSAVANGLALSILHERALAQEIVHDAFLKIWAKPSLYDPSRAAFSTFLLTMVRYAAISKLRGFKITLPLEDEEGAPLPLPDHRVNLLEHSEQRQRAERVQAVLRELKPVQRETIERAFYQGQSREFIAEAMQVPVGTVKSRLKYTLDRLRGLLGEDFESDTPAVKLTSGGGDEDAGSSKRTERV